MQKKVQEDFFHLRITNWTFSNKVQLLVLLVSPCNNQEIHTIKPYHQKTWHNTLAIRGPSYFIKHNLLKTLGRKRQSDFAMIENASSKPIGYWPVTLSRTYKYSYKPSYTHWFVYQGTLKDRNFDYFWPSITETCSLSKEILSCVSTATSGETGRFIFPFLNDTFQISMRLQCSFHYLLNSVYSKVKVSKCHIWLYLIKQFLTV